MKKNITSSIILTALLFFKCGPPTTVIEIKSGKRGGLYEMSNNGIEYKVNNSAQSVKLNTSTVISFADFERVQTENSQQGLYSINFSLSEPGKVKFKEMTERNLQKQVYFVVDDKIIAAPVIQEVIANGFVSLTLPDKKILDDIIKYLEN